jgi:hypothetical protein
MLFISSLEAVVETQGESEPRPVSATPIPHKGGELKKKFFECERCSPNSTAAGLYRDRWIWNHSKAFFQFVLVAEILQMDRRCMFYFGPFGAENQMRTKKHLILEQR